MTAEPLSFSVIGSVDNGKSSLIGRLLYDTSSLLEDQMKDFSRDGELNFAHVTDGLKEERERGITIDVCHRFFTSNKRSFHIYDCPGHVEFTPHMVTASSQVDIAVLLVDALEGMSIQLKRHLMACHFSGVESIIVCVNKMDLVDFEFSRFEELKKSIENFVEKFSFREISFIPISAMTGDNIAKASTRTPWFKGETLLNKLENYNHTKRERSSFCFIVQQVFKGEAIGKVISGEYDFKKAANLYVRGERAQLIAARSIMEKSLKKLSCDDTPVLNFETDIELKRGDIITSRALRTSNSFHANLYWVSDFDPTRAYACIHLNIIHQCDDIKLKENSGVSVRKNDFVKAEICLREQICFDSYKSLRELGAFILVDCETNQTVAAGTIL